MYIGIYKLNITPICVYVYVAVGMSLPANKRWRVVVRASNKIVGDNRIGTNDDLMWNVLYCISEKKLKTSLTHELGF